MRPNTSNELRTVVCLLVAVLTGGCAEKYKGIVKPVPRLSVLSPDLENLTDGKIETYLKADAQPVFPTVLAVAKAAPGSGRYIQGYRGDSARSPLVLEVLRGEEAEGWRKFDSLKTDAGGPLVNQVQFISGMLTGEPVTRCSMLRYSSRTFRQTATRRGSILRPWRTGRSSGFSPSPATR